MEAAKSAANEEMQENKHTDYIYMVTYALASEQYELERNPSTMY